MSAVVLNEVRKGLYLDSVALMRMSRTVAACEGVEEAALMMGTPANREILDDAGLLAKPGSRASGGDLVIAVRAVDQSSAKSAMIAASNELDAPASRSGDSMAWRPKSLRMAVATLPEANIALISVPGAFAAAEARKAIRRGLHAMIFSDNVPIEEEAELKREAKELGVLVMGPDCGTAIIAGIPLAFANAVPRGSIGIVGASGTGIQEVACLIAREGGGISHAIGVGGRDLDSRVGGISTLMSIDALARDQRTERIVVIAKPPDVDVAEAVLDRLGNSGKPGIVCFIGSNTMKTPATVRQVFTLKDAAFSSLGQSCLESWEPALQVRKADTLGLFSGGSLCAEAQIFFRNAGIAVSSNAPIAGVRFALEGPCVLLDLGDDEFTKGRPHPMIDPQVRHAALTEALGRDDLGVILADVVIGYGAHHDPAGQLAETVLATRSSSSPDVICSVTGTDDDPQCRSNQVEKLERAGILVAPSNADMARFLAASNHES